jgi:hypothetical protein
MGTPVSITNGSGDIEVRNTASDVSIDTRRAPQSFGHKWQRKISGRAGRGAATPPPVPLTLDGEFVPSAPTKWRKACASFQRTDLTLTQLTGHLETSSASLKY